MLPNLPENRGMNALGANLPADSFERIAAATARLYANEQMLNASRMRGIAILSDTTRRMEAFNRALAQTAKLASPSQKRAMSANPTAPQFGSPIEGSASFSGMDPKTFREVMSNMDKIGSSIENAFRRGVDAMRGFVQAASPSEWSTLTTSFQLLSAELGVVLLPYFEQASRAVQATASWLKNLDETTKTTIGRVVIAGLAIGGFVLVWRQLIAILTIARTVITTTYGVMAATPLGAVVALTAVVAALAAAWWGVNSAANAAGGTQRLASQRIGTGEGNKAEGELSNEELAALPKGIQDRFRRIADAQKRLDNFANLNKDEKKKLLDEVYSNQADKDAITGAVMLPDADRAVMQQRLDDARRNTVRELNRNPESLLSMLPRDVREQIDKNPERRKAIIEEYQQSVEDRAMQLRRDAPKMFAEEEKDREKRQALFQKAAFTPEMQAEIDKQVAAYATRKGVNANKAIMGLSLEPDAPENKAIRDAFLGQIKRFDPDTDATGAELSQGRLQVNPNNPNSAFMQVGKLPQRETLQSLLAESERVRGVSSALSMLVTSVEKQGGNKNIDDFARNLKPPIQSRFTDAYGYQESAQLAILNQGDADAKLLQRQMEILSKVMGDLSEAIKKYNAAQDKGMSAGGFMSGIAGWLDLGN